MCLSACNKNCRPKLCCADLPIEDVSGQTSVDVSQERREKFVAERENEVAPVDRKFCLERDVTIQIHLQIFTIKRR